MAVVMNVLQQQTMAGVLVSEVRTLWGGCMCKCCHVAAGAVPLSTQPLPLSLHAFMCAALAPPPPPTNVGVHAPSLFLHMHFNSVHCPFHRHPHP